MTKIFNLLIVFLINTLLFVSIEQKSKTEVRKQPFKCSLRKMIKQGKSLKNNFEESRFW